MDEYANIANSVLFQSGSGSGATVGINTTTPAATLHVNGTENVEGLLTLPATGAALATGGKNSQAEDFIASSFNSGTAAAVNQTFQWRAEPAGNNTATPSGTLNRLFGSGTSTPSETGLKLSSKGLFTFAIGQTFPGTGTIAGVTAGTGLTGGGTSGKVTLNVDTTKVAQLKTANSFTGNQTVSGSVTATSFSGNGAAISNVNASQLGGLAPTAFAQLAANNTFSGAQTINNSVAVTSNISFGSALNVTDTGTGNAIQAFADNSSGYALYGGNTGATGTGVGGNSNAGNGVAGNSTSGNGVFGQSAGGSTAGVSGVNTASGVGVYGNSTGGYAFSSDNHTTQARTMGGWVKAMAYVNASSNQVVSCFNSQLTGSAASNPPCGLAVTSLGVGNPIVDFGFEVNDRFVVVTPVSSGGNLPTAMLFPFNITQNQVRLYLYDLFTQQGVDSPFYIFVL